MKHRATITGCEECNRLTSEVNRLLDQGERDFAAKMDACAEAEELRIQVRSLRARVAELEAMLPGQHTVGATICAEETMPESLQSALAEAERGELLDMDDVIPPAPAAGS